MKAKKMPMGPDRGHQTLDLQGYTPKPSRGHAAHDALHGRGHKLPRRPGARRPFNPGMISQGEEY